MYRFISNDGIIANNADTALAVVNASLRVGAARKWSAGIASADPIMVCGLVNLQRTMGKGTFFSGLSSGIAFSIETSDSCNFVFVFPTGR